MEKRNSITAGYIGGIVARTEFKTLTVYDKTTIVSAKLPNGFVIVESSSCVDPENYDVKTGEGICRSKIINKIWELEGYKLQDELYRKSQVRDIRDFTLWELIDRGYDFRIESNISERGKVIIDDGRG